MARSAWIVLEPLDSVRLSVMKIKKEFCWVASPLLGLVLTAADVSKPFDYDQPHLHGTEYSITETHPALSYCFYSATGSPAGGGLAVMVSPPADAFLTASAPWNQTS